MSENFEVVLNPQSYLPDPEYKARSRLGDYKKTYRSFWMIPAFWDRMAREIEWMKPWNKVLEWDFPYARWFCGGTLNITVNCLDRHIRRAEGINWP